MDRDIKEWLDKLQERLIRSQHAIRKEQALMELLVKITDLMKAGNFKDAAFLRDEFDKIKTESEARQEDQFFG